VASCGQCGESIREDAAFCTSCGTPVEPPVARLNGEAVPADDLPSAEPPPPPPPSETVDTTPSGKRPIPIGTAIAAVVGIIVVGSWLVWQQSGSGDTDTAAATTTSFSSESTISTSTTTEPSTTSTTDGTTTTTLPPTTTTLPADLLSGLEATGVFVEEGNGADPASLQTSIDMARAQGWDLSVVASTAEPEDGASAYAGSIATAIKA
jgi:hypothetical protein